MGNAQFKQATTHRARMRHPKIDAMDLYSFDKSKVTGKNTARQIRYVLPDAFRKVGDGPFHGMILANLLTFHKLSVGSKRV